MGFAFDWDSSRAVVNVKYTQLELFLLYQSSEKFFLSTPYDWPFVIIYMFAVAHGIFWFTVCIIHETQYVMCTYFPDSISIYYSHSLDIFRQFGNRLLFSSSLAHTKLSMDTLLHNYRPLFYSWSSLKQLFVHLSPSIAFNFLCWFLLLLNWNLFTMLWFANMQYVLWLFLLIENGTFE